MRGVRGRRVGLSGRCFAGRMWSLLPGRDGRGRGGEVRHCEERVARRAAELRSSLAGGVLRRRQSGIVVQSTPPRRISIHGRPRREGACRVKARESCFVTPIEGPASSRLGGLRGAGARDEDRLSSDEMSIQFRPFQIRETAQGNRDTQEERPRKNAGREAARWGKRREENHIALPIGFGWSPGFLKLASGMGELRYPRLCREHEMVTAKRRRK